MKRKRIVILGQPFTVEWKVPDDETDAGQMIFFDRKIIINPNKPRQDETLVHEIIHAALAVGGWSDVLGKKEESLTRLLEHALSPIVKVVGLEGIEDE